MEEDERFLNLSEMTTPDALSIPSHEGTPAAEGVDGGDSERSECAKKRKAHSEFVVRLKKPPHFKFVKNKYDSYLTKTSLRAINFSENKKRWMRIIEKDLYSKTENRGVPRL